MKITTIGGGTGSPVVLRALVAAGFNDLNAICAAMDSGGRSGMIKIDERGQIISISDWMRNLFALIDKNDNHRKGVEIFINALDFTDGRGRNLGYTLAYSLLEKNGNDYEKVQSDIEEILEIKFKGRAIPVTMEPTTLCFETDLGDVFKGEHLLDKYSASQMKISNLWIEPDVKAEPEATRSIEEADYIIYSPGSVSGSILSCFLPNGMKEALKKSKAKKVMVANLISQRNETHEFMPEDFVKLFQKYTGLTNPVDLIVTSDISRKRFDEKYPDIADRYQKMTYSHFFGWDDRQLKGVRSQGVVVVRADLFSVVPDKKIIRHDSEKLDKILKGIIENL